MDKPFSSLKTNGSKEHEARPSTKHTQGQTVHLQKEQHSSCLPCEPLQVTTVGRETRDQAGLLECVQPINMDVKGRGRNMWLLQKTRGLMTVVPMDRDAVERRMINWPAAGLSSFNTMLKAPPEWHRYLILGKLEDKEGEKFNRDIFTVTAVTAIPQAPQSTALPALSSAE